MVDAFQPLSIAALRAAEWEFCRSKKRVDWWRGTDNVESALGRMLDDLREYRNRKEWRGAGPALTQERLRELLIEDPQHSIASSTFSNFLLGKASGRNLTQTRYRELVKDGIEVVLTGSLRPAVQLPRDSRIVADRIGSFLLRNCENGGGEHRADWWFFDPRLRQFGGPATTEEANAELRALAYEVETNLVESATIIRTSGDRRFLQVKKETDALTPSGRLTLECLNVGIDVHFVYPTPASNSERSEAAKSAEFVKNTAARELSAQAHKRLNLVPLDPTRSAKDSYGRKRWAGEFLSFAFRYAFYIRRLRNKEPMLTLLFSRSADFGPSTFDADSREIAAFRTWAECFVPTAGGGAPVR